MIGHDVVPHIDEIHSNDISNSISFEIQVEHSHSDLSHIFEHFQHFTNDRNLTYLTGVEKVIKTTTKTIANNFLYSELEKQELWHTNREKQRFRDYLVKPYSVNFYSYSLRGPPLC
ncbi:hypothetical protein SAMN05428642_10530 [Flaviramulus basaltis]|uniref:Uncharacterized protein n=2 Tax=Flaviramulus basaltis TaxID=369401 RepID=A0A1K2IQN3_9FLAO|nr:hypothetical protein SAMN05428642_10530 [Flaviramulus basaltis]|tara:strand:+ start:1959 stop:2306 length:348 start_codon:yes stop_codon:yes gene_type:complete